jgi:hypothetical protein
MTLGRTSSGAIKIKTDGGLRAVECACCSPFQLTIKYSWEGTGQRDLDTKTEAFGDTVGYACVGSRTYVQWIGGDDTRVDGFEQVDIRVIDARRDGLWSSSANIACFAGWYAPAQGSGSAALIVEYRGKSKTKTISPGSQSDCASTSVGTVTVYSAIQADESFFEIL